MTPSAALSKITEARVPADLFPDKVAAAAVFRDLAKAVHPDRAPVHERPAHAEAFKKLNQFYSATTAALVTLGRWSVKSPLTGGDICDLYLAGGAQQAAVKIARSQADNPLMDREARALRAIAKAHVIGEHFGMYFPALLDDFHVSGRRANVITEATGTVPLTEIAVLVPAPDFRHIVWMMNRTLTALGYAHRAGMGHGAVTPDHLMFIPQSHGLVLVDWCCSMQSGTEEYIPLVVDRWKDLYPREVRRKEISNATDIYMAAKCIEYASGATRPPRRFRDILQWMAAPSPHARPTDAWEVQEHWKQAAEEEYGPPKFLDFALPKQ